MKLDQQRSQKALQAVRNDEHRVLQERSLVIDSNNQAKITVRTEPPGTRRTELELRRWGTGPELDVPSVPIKNGQSRSLRGIVKRVSGMSNLREPETNSTPLNGYAKKGNRHADVITTTETAAANDCFEDTAEVKLYEGKGKAKVPVTNYLFLELQRNKT